MASFSEKVFDKLDDIGKTVKFIQPFWAEPSEQVDLLSVVIGIVSRWQLLT